MSSQQLQQRFDNTVDDDNNKETMVPKKPLLEEITTEPIKEETIKEVIIKYKIKFDNVLQNIEKARGNLGVS